MKKYLKMIVDILMSIMLVLLMSFQVVGNKYHEWIGTGTILLFIIHNVLNYKWYQVMFKGKWSLQRFFRTLINIAVLISFVITAYGGIEISRHVFSFLPNLTSVSIARKIHLAGSYWLFTLICLHIGIHWNQMTIISKIKSNKVTLQPSALDGLRESYACLAYTGISSGRSINNELPGRDRPESVEEIYKELENWLYEKEK